MPTYNFDGFQIPHAGLDQDMGTAGGQTARPFNMRISNFGALNFGNRSSSDYTKILYQDKSRIENPDIPVWATENDKNPYTRSSGVNARFRTLNDEFTIMGIGNRRSNTATDAPKMDVSDKYAMVDDGTNVPTRFPKEGWSTFGGRTAGPPAYVLPGYQTRVGTTASGNAILV